MHGVVGNQNAQNANNKCIFTGLGEGAAENVGKNASTQTAGAANGTEVLAGCENKAHGGRTLTARLRICIQATRMVKMPLYTAGEGVRGRGKVLPSALVVRR